MPQEYRNLINRVLRDFQGYTGDGQGGNGALPVGDPSTARKPIDKRDLRTVLLASDNAAETASQAALDATGAMVDAQGATLFAGSLSALQSNGASSYPVGTLFLTRQEGAVMRVVAGSEPRPHLTTAGGVRMVVDRWERSDRGALAEIGLRAQNGEAVRIACYGDSTVLGVDGVTETFNTWPNRLGSMLRVLSGNDDVLTYNAGSGGKKVIDWWATDNFADFVSTPYSAAQYVMLGFGLNDIKDDTAPIWNPDLFKTRYLHLINQIRLSGRTPIMVAPILISSAPIRPNPLIQGELMNATREIAEIAQVDLVDFNSTMTAWQRDRTDQYRIGDFQTDGTHPSDDVYVALAGSIVRDIYQDRIIDANHGARFGPHNATYSPDVSVSYNRNMSNAWGFSAQLTATENVNIAAEIWVWSDKARKAIYVSPDRSVVSGTNPAYAYVDKLGTSSAVGVEIDFGLASGAQTDKPSESHIFVADLPFGLSRLRFRCGGAGVFEFGGWLTVDRYDPVSVAAYSVSTDRELFLPGNFDSRPEIFPKFAASTNMLLVGSIPVGWGVVIGTQYVFQDASNAGPSRRKMSIVALRTSTGCDIIRVGSGNTGVFSATSIKTSGTGDWAGQISFHAVTVSGNVEIQVRADGQIIAAHNLSGTAPFHSPYGRMGGLYRDGALVSDPAGRQAVANLVLMGR